MNDQPEAPMLFNATLEDQAALVAMQGILAMQPHSLRNLRDPWSVGEALRSEIAEAAWALAKTFMAKRPR